MWSGYEEERLIETHRSRGVDEREREADEPLVNLRDPHVNEICGQVAPLARVQPGCPRDVKRLANLLRARAADGLRA